MLNRAAARDPCCIDRAATHDRGAQYIAAIGLPEERVDLGLLEIADQSFGRLLATLIVARYTTRVDRPTHSSKRASKLIALKR